MTTSIANRRGIAVMAFTALLCAGATTHAARSPDSPATERAFAKEAIEGNLAEIRIGRLAQRRGASEAVRQFGRRLERDHAAGLQKARSLATSLGATPPTAPNASQTATYDRLSRLSGPEFDRRFAERMVADHKDDVAAFAAEARGTGPAAAFARRILPTLEAHLQEAKALPAKKRG